MKTILLSVLVLSFLATSCFREEDPGPLQSDQRTYSILDFDRLDAGDAFVITVQQSPVYSINVQGDRRNLDDLQITKSGSTLKIQFSNSRQRDHATYIAISMPAIRGANFSGACNATLTGFKSQSESDLILSGASICQYNGETRKMSVTLSGSSKITLSGSSGSVMAKVSGASELHAYDLNASDFDADASGSSSLNVFASQTLRAVASGSSVIFYRGNPSVTSSATGASTIRQD